MSAKRSWVENRAQPSRGQRLRIDLEEARELAENERAISGVLQLVDEREHAVSLGRDRRRRIVQSRMAGELPEARQRREDGEAPVRTGSGGCHPSPGRARRPRALGRRSYVRARVRPHGSPDHRRADRPGRLRPTSRGSGVERVEDIVSVHRIDALPAEAPQREGGSDDPPREREQRCGEAVDETRNGS